MIFNFFKVSSQKICLFAKLIPLVALYNYDLLKEPAQKIHSFESQTTTVVLHDHASVMLRVITNMYEEVNLPVPKTESPIYQRTTRVYYLITSPIVTFNDKDKP